MRPVDKGEEARARVGLAEVETVIPKVGGGAWIGLVGYKLKNGESLQCRLIMGER